MRVGGEGRPATDEPFRLGRRGLHVQVVLVVFAALLFVAALGVGFRIRAAEVVLHEELRESWRIQSAALDLKFASADLNGWQTAYALDALRTPNGKIDVDALTTRASFVERARATEQGLARLLRRELNSEERTQLRLAQEHFAEFMDLDATVAAHLTSNDQSRFVVATALVLEDAIMHSQAMLEPVHRLVAEANARADRNVEMSRHIARQRQALSLSFALGAILVSIGLVFLLVHSRSSNVRLLRDLEGTATSAMQNAEHIKLLQDIAMAANAAQSVSEALQYALDRVCESAGWPVGHAFIVADDGSGDLVSARVWHIRDPERFARFRKQSERIRFKPGEGLPGRVRMTGKPAKITDVEVDSNFPRVSSMRDSGARAGFAFPIQVGAETAAVLEFFSDIIDPDEVLLDIMANVAMILGRVIERTRAVEFQNRLMGIVSHDLKNPLSSLTLGVERMKSVGCTDCASSDVLHRMLRSLERMSRIVADLLDDTSARVHLSLPVNVREVDFDAVCRGLIAEFAQTHPTREIRYTTAGSGVGRWDPDRVTQMMQNLISNALKYSPDGSPIDVRWEAAHDMLHISVCNRGEPISPEALPFVFEPFRRGTFRRDKSSVGLGLYIVSSVVRAHGGTVSVRSSREAGTTFEVHLAKAPTAAPAPLHQAALAEA